MTTDTKELIRQVKTGLSKTSHKGSPAVVKNENNGTYELSVYGRGEVSPNVLGEQLLKLKIAFPSRSDEFFNVLAERIVANGFTDRRLKDAVSKVIDSFSFKEFNVSDIVSFDKRVKLYTYSELGDMISKGYRMEDFEIKKVDGKNFWIKISEKHQQNI